MQQRAEPMLVVLCFFPSFWVTVNPRPSALLTDLGVKSGIVVTVSRRPLAAIEVFVQFYVTPGMAGGRVSVTVGAGRAVRVLQRLVSEEAGLTLPPTLFYRGVQLAPEKKLDDYGITEATELWDCAEPTLQVG